MNGLDGYTTSVHVETSEMRRTPHLLIPGDSYVFISIVTLNDATVSHVPALLISKQPTPEMEWVMSIRFPL